MRARPADFFNQKIGNIVKDGTAISGLAGRVKEGAASELVQLVHQLIYGFFSVGEQKINVLNYLRLLRLVDVFASFVLCGGHFVLQALLQVLAVAAHTVLPDLVQLLLYRLRLLRYLYVLERLLHLLLAVEQIRWRFAVGRQARGGI